MLCNVNAQCDVNIAMYGNGNKNVITEKKNVRRNKIFHGICKLTETR